MIGEPRIETLEGKRLIGLRTTASVAEDGVWLPASGFVLADRPHFAVMDERYRGEDPDSEEEIWIPVEAGDTGRPD